MAHKIVAVGDGGCGKTCLFTVFAKGQFPKGYIPTVFETFRMNFHFMGQRIYLELWDTAGQEDYDLLRPLSYPGAEIILICFSIEQPVSLENVQGKWVSEVRHFSHGVPIFLVACKIDLRDDPRTITRLWSFNQEPITTEQGQDVAKKINATHYIECSALTGEGVMEVFRIASRELIMYNKIKNLQKKRKCLIL